MRECFWGWVLAALLCCGASVLQADDVRKDFKPIIPAEIKEGVRIIRLYCLNCHGTENKTQDSMIAPSLWGVRQHYIRRYKSDAEFVTAMTEFLLTGDEEKSVMPKAVEKHGVMSVLPLDEDKLRAASVAIFAGQVKRPPWAKRYEQELAESDEGAEKDGE